MFLKDTLPGRILQSTSCTPIVAFDMDNLDRRSSIRVPAAATVVVRTADELFEAEVIDIGPGGIGFLADSEPKSKEALEMSIGFCDAQRFDVLGIVAHTFARSDGRTRVGVALYGMSPEEQSVWEQIVRSKLPSDIDPMLAMGSNPTSLSPQLYPQLFLRPRSTSELRAIWARDLPRSRMFISTKLHLAPEASVVVNIVHPKTGRSFLLEGQVRRSLAVPAIRGLSLVFPGLNQYLLDAFRGFIDEDGHVNVDICSERIDEADVEALLRA